ncbi:MAG TPA: SapC family protein [Caulobacteraceae bacterium]|nr:SapC family protein [Caulobacteraceae bacterium]
MAVNKADPQSPVTGNVLLYERPEPLDPRRHGNLGLHKLEKPFGFVAKQHFVPLHVGEFGPASVNYPIIFAGETRAPLAVVGVTPGENLHVSDDGAWRTGVYVPAFIRRYPFVGALDEQAQKMVVCIDRASPLWIEGGGDVPLFENGQPTEFTKSCIEFCSQFDVERRQTDLFVKMLADLNLFETRQTTYTPRTPDGEAGEPQLVAEFFGVSEDRLKTLPKDKLVELRDNGALGQIYAHMISLFNWERLLAESVLRRGEVLPA